MKRVFSIVAALALTVTAALPAFAFSDVKDTTQNEAAQALSSLAIMEGWDGNFHPEDSFSREMFAKVAVKAMGLESLCSQYKDYTIFPDVLNTSWSAPYVNVSAKKAIIGGFPDGTFRPGADITNAEAITICLRVLGYKTSDIGPVWPDNYIQKADELGLTKGLSLKADGKMNRGSAAVLVRNMLMTETYSEGAKGDLLIKSQAKTTVGDVAILKIGGSLGEKTIQTSNGNYECANAMDPSLAGTRGILLMSTGNVVIGYIPYNYTSVTINATAATSSYVEGGGKRYTVQPTAQVLINGESKKYSECWYDIRGGMTITVNLDDKGGVVYLACGYAGGLSAPF